LRRDGMTGLAPAERIFWVAVHRYSYSKIDGRDLA
jgi:hypothetical protein